MAVSVGASKRASFVPTTRPCLSTVVCPMAVGTIDTVTVSPASNVPAYTTLHDPRPPTCSTVTPLTCA